MAGKKKKVEETVINADTIDEIHSATENYANAIGSLAVVAATSESQLKAGVDKHARRIAGGDYGLDNLLLEELYTGLVVASSDPAEARGHFVNVAAIAAVAVDSIDHQLSSDHAAHNEEVEEQVFDHANDNEPVIEEPASEDEEPTADEILAAADDFADLAE